jgi:hypothetical protein
MSNEPPRVISIERIGSVNRIDGDLTVAVELVTPDDQPFAVLLSVQLAAELQDKLAKALPQQKRPASGGC